MGTVLVGMTASTANASFTFGFLFEAAESLFLSYILPVAVTVKVFDALPEKLNFGVKSVVSTVAGVTVLSIVNIDKVLLKYEEELKRGKREANEKEDKINNEAEEKGSEKTGKTKNYLVGKNSSSKYMFLP